MVLMIIMPAGGRTRTAMDSIEWLQTGLKDIEEETNLVDVEQVSNQRGDNDTSF